MRRSSLLSVFLCLFIVGAALTFVPPVLAQVNTGLAEVGQTVNLNSTDPRIIASRIINIALGLVGIILVSLLIYAGFLYMTSGGDTEKVARARKIIVSSIVGLIIVLSSWAIARFVIERLLQATQGGGGSGGASQQGGGGGGFGGSGGSNAFQVSSITPQGNVSIRNVQIKMLFSRPVDDKTVSAIVVTQTGGAAIGGTFTVNNSTVTFTPNAACPDPNGTLKCFESDSDITVQIGTALRSTQGQTLVCGGFAPGCTASFRVGSLIDTQNPTVTITSPTDGQAIPADSLVDLQAQATDDSGVAYIEFYDNGQAVGQSGPNASTTPQTFAGLVSWDTTGVPLQSIRQLTSKAFDIDAHEGQSATVNVVVRSPSCFNGVKDGTEEDIDCGGTLNTPGYCGACMGGQCVSNMECSSGVCQSGTCVAQPTITAVTPNDGKPGTYVTVQGSNFGSAGSIVFLGNPGAADDVVAQPPQACVQANTPTWSSNQAVVVVPAGAVIGPIQITNTASQLSDLTNDTQGPQIPDFLVNDTAHPGLCALNPNQGYVGSQFTAVGQGFGASPSSVSFGGSSLTSFAGWADDQVTANVPVVGTGKHSVTVNVGNESSNAVTYLVQSKSSAGSPTIVSIDPVTGPKGEYITLLGSNFGANVGTVRFKNKLTNDEALGDTSFPEACSQAFWTETEIVVKVPSVFLNTNANISPGDYSVHITRSDAADSNLVDFVVSSGVAKPGICAITPSVGPVGTPITVTGERLGSSNETLTFQSGISAVVASWANDEIESTVPTGAVTGPVTVAVQGVTSNGVNFQVRNCNEQAGICSQSQQCCANGTCIGKDQVCGAVVQNAMYAWQSSTGLIPIAPQVVEECLPGQAQAPLPSPAPWDKRAGGDQVCVSATVTTRFTTQLDPVTVTAANFKLKKCTSSSTDPCSTTTDVTLASGFPLLQPASQSQDAVILQPSADFETDSTYLVEVLTGVRSPGASGAPMAAQGNCGPGVGYCFRFKTRSSSAPCSVGAVSVAPHPYELNDTGATVDYLASPLSADDACVVLQCDNYDWAWQNGDDNNPDGRAIFQTPLAGGVLPGTIACRQTGVAVSETGNVPVNMNATVKPDEVKGTAHLYVKFIPPAIEDYAPDCNLACLNALIWVRFSVPLEPTSIAGNVEIRRCGNENCVLSELGSPLPIDANAYQLTTVPKTSETTLRFLQINPVDANGNLLLIPGSYYRVLLKSGPTGGLTGLNGVPMTGLNAAEGFAWTFRTKIGEDAFCTAESVDMSPIQKYETSIGARQLFQATAFGEPDECSATGQMLMQSQTAVWSTSDAQVADYVKAGTIDTGGVLPGQCSALCLAMGSQGQFGKVAVCGNGIVETTDAVYCAAYNAANGSGCSVLPLGAKDAEQCDPGISAHAGLCDATSCLWKPQTQYPQGTCGNGTIETGESCDFGLLCLGASPTSTTPDYSSCTSSVDQAACVANGGSCAPRQYRGCSAFCRHTGSQSANSTCGNADIADGEDCDDGNTSSGDGCSNQCLHTGSQANVVSVCGNAILESGETCEKINLNDATFPFGCNGVSCLHTGTGQCDNDPNTPNINCCGNGTADAGEDCDDANKTAGDGCSVSCLLEGSSAGYVPTPSFCSDGLLEVGEQCEVGLPSSHVSLLSPNLPKNAVPVAPLGSQNGDGLIDNVQLAYIVGDADPDAQGLMSSQLSAQLEGKTGQATYGLQCGFTDENACQSGDGLTDQGCCSIRPAILTNYPVHDSTDVCRNVQIAVDFNTAMDVASVAQNIQIAASETGVSCPAGTVQVTDNFDPIHSGVLGWIQRRWQLLVAWITGNPAYADIWCTGSVAGSLVPSFEGSETSFVYRLNSALNSQTKYRIKFLGDDSDPLNPLSDNSDLTKKKGIKSKKGVVVAYDGSDAGPLTWSFTTGDKVCAVNLVQVTDTDPVHPLLFTKPDETHVFDAEAISLQDGVVVPITPVAEYSWSWSPWTTSANDIIQVADPNAGAPSASIVAENKNGTAFAVAWLNIVTDTINSPSTTGSTVQGTAPVTVLLCENPWPSLAGPGPLAPFRDKQPTGDGSDSSLTGTIFEAGPFFNFSTTYCRDAGVFGIEDDLPNLEINMVPATSVDGTEGILRQYLFTYGDSDEALKKDGIGIRVAVNPLHLSPEDWYEWRGFGGNPQSIMIDGYRALKDGTTTYVAAANTENVGENMYSNIYLISHNPDASPITVGIYDQMVKNLAFNINLTQEVSNVCMEGNDPNVATNGPLLVNGASVSCSSDFDCLKFTDDTHCGSFKLKLSRDSVRMADYQAMSHAIERYRQANGSYPKLEGGTYLQGLTTSRWPSWSAAFSEALGGTQPVDPVNQYLTCGRCSQSQAVCGGDADCPSGETCAAVNVNSATYDPLACWDVVKRQYLCPKIGKSPSRLYQYRSLNDGERYELGSEFELPKASAAGAKWWVPDLTQELKRCTNPGSSLGFMCDVDEDCRPCANPKDLVACPLNAYPVTPGACRPAGGRFLYQDVCTNIPYGQGGTCGDGVLGTQCVGGANNGIGCAVNSDCPGGACSGLELCEIGQTQVTDCSVDPNSGTLDGLKLQVCNECKEFIDDPALSKCDAGLMCGNGRVDKQCIGGPRSSLSCFADADCPSTPNMPAAYCGPTSEICDDGSLNGSYGHCNLTCSGYASYCGDSQISPGESCDLAGQNGAYCGQGCNVAQSCSLNCKGQAPYCGDGILTAPNEECDGETVTTLLGICIAGTGIDQTCTTDADCGNGGMCATSGNLASCQGVTKNRCATALKQCVPASGTVSGPSYDPSAHIICQDDSDCSGGEACRSIQDYVVDCTSDTQCSAAGIPGTCNSYPTAHIRSCSASAPDACTYPTLPTTNSSWSECKILNFCGDGVIDAPGEECDDGSKNGDTKACTSSCKKNVCGDGKPFINVEECDNGSQNGQITCSSDYGSTCASCSNQCKFLTTSGGYCGDQTKNGSEQCDGTNAVTVVADQFNNCSALPGKNATICPYVNADCLQSPCQQTKETGVTCKSLGYDFAINGTEPKLIPLDPALNVLHAGSACTTINSMMEYEYLAYKACLGLICKSNGPVDPQDDSQVQYVPVQASAGAALSKYLLASNAGFTYTLQYKNPLPTTNEFWQCVKDLGPALGVGIQTKNAPELVQCGLSCSFAGCGKCSDESGTGIIDGQLIDAVYNQVVAFAKVSLFYKGVLVSQTSSDEDGKFQLNSLNNRLECTQYKLVIDKYDDNPCTGSANRPNCGLPAAPDWNYPYNVQEDQRGGYWPLTTQSFSVGSFDATVSPQGDGRIFLYPRPGVGEAYMTVLWDTDWSTNDTIWGGYNNHVILPKAYAYTAANSNDVAAANYPASFNPTTCSYDNRPALNHECVRDVTWGGTLRGDADLTKLPHAQLICLHKAGDKVGGYIEPNPNNGCPVEGRDKCVQNLGGQDPTGMCSDGVTASCVGGPNNGDNCSTDAQCPSGSCPALPCDREWWDTCDFYKDGPLTTYFRYSAFAGSQEPIKLKWGYWNKSVHPVLNGGSNSLLSHLQGKGYKVVVSTDQQVVELSAQQVTESCGKDCKFWDIAEINPTDASISIQNSLVGSRPEGVAIYQFDFQGSFKDDAYCVANNTLYKLCTTDSDCAAIPSATCVDFTASNNTAQHIQWSQANY